MSLPNINTATVHGTHTLFRLTTGLEPLKLRIFFDATFLEIFANDRFALSTHLYGGICEVKLYTSPRLDEKRGELQARAWHFINHKS